MHNPDLNFPFDQAQNKKFAFPKSERIILHCSMHFVILKFKNKIHYFIHVFKSQSFIAIFGV